MALPIVLNIFQDLGKVIGISNRSRGSDLSEERNEYDRFIRVYRGKEINDINRDFRRDLVRFFSSKLSRF